MRSENLRGIGLMLLAMATLAIMDAAMKHLVATFPPIQVAALRGLVSLPFVLVWVYWRERNLVTLARVRWRWHLAR
ncbi:MAG: EamA family transporter, partial [Geminicoccales bacterium]